MKKSKLLVGVLVASMALLGTGYAYWTDQLTVNATVTTGELKVVYTENQPDGITGELNETKEIKSSEKPKDHLYSLNKSSWPNRGTWYCYVKDGSKPNHNWKQGKELGLSRHHEYANSWFIDTQQFETIPGTKAGEEIVTDITAKGDLGSAGYITEAKATASEKGVTINVKNFYPGSFAATTFEIQNVGTIPAVIDEILSTPDMNDLEEAMQVVAVLGEVDSITDELLAGQRPVSEIAEVLADIYENTKLEPEDTLKTTLIFILPGAVETFESDYVANNIVEESFNIEINWIQHNALKTVEKSAE
jgi:predicted ribosomally synthesized peptide with SipW-like signal peptide